MFAGFYYIGAGLVETPNSLFALKIDNPLPGGSELQWPYRLQEHPDDPTRLGSQQIMGKAMAPEGKWRRIGFGGPKGGGKSYGARAVAFGLTYRLPIVIVIVRSRLTTLKRNHILPAKNELRDFLDREIIKYSEQDKIFYMPSGGMVMFMHCSRPADVDQFDGVSADVYVFEEAGHFTEEMMKGIYKNNRPSDVAINRNANYMPRVLFTFNWGGPGHAPLRRWFWDKDYEENERKEDYLFIFAPLDQNRALLDKDPTYKQTLLELPPQLREAYLHGDPDAFVGTMFTVVNEIHEVDPIELLEPYNDGRDPKDYMIPDHWRLIGSLDAGVGAPCSFGLYAVTPKGQKYKLMQYYGEPPPGGSIKAPTHVDTIIDKINACRWTGGRHPEFIVSDGYAFQKHNQMDIEGGDITWEDLFAQHRLPLYEVKYNRITAIMGLHTALHFEYNDTHTELEVVPALQFFAGECKATFEELRAAERNENDPELIANDAKDHAIDETKNLLLCAENPPDFVPVKKVRKKDPRADYGSKIDRIEKMLNKISRQKETFRNAM